MLSESKLLKGMKAIEEFLDKGDISEVTAETQKLSESRGGRTEYEGFRDLAGQASDVKKRAELFSEKLAAELGKAGYYSVGDWDSDLDKYYSSHKRIIRPSIKEMKGFIIPLCPPGYKVGGKFVFDYAFKGDYDFTYVVARERDEVIFSEFEPEENYIDRNFCDQNDIAISPITFPSGRNARYLYHRGTVSYNLLFKEEIWASQEMLRRLHQLLLKNTFTDFGVATHMEGNDVVADGSGKKVGGIRMWFLNREHPKTHVMYDKNVWNLVGIFNTAWDPGLASGALRGGRQSGDEVTSLSDEAGRVVNPVDVKNSFMKHLARLFNVKVKEVEWSD